MGSTDDIKPPNPSSSVPGGRKGGRRRTSNGRRALLAISAVVGAEVVGTVGFHAIESVSWVNAFYFESMLATGQGPPFTLYTNAGKIFASIMGFVSVGSTLTAVVFTVGPLIARMWRDALERVESGARRLGRDAEAEIRKLENDLR